VTADRSSDITTLRKTATPIEVSNNVLMSRSSALFAI